MAKISFQVVDGVDKGRGFTNLETPITIGREEGNSVRLNDERVSRFHAKVQEDQGQVVLTDLDSTNGTRVNGESVQLRLLRPGDRVSLGRSTLIFGTIDQIAGVCEEEDESSSHSSRSAKTGVQEKESRYGLGTELSASNIDAFLDADQPVDVFRRDPPQLPGRLSPAQAAQLSEAIDFLHRALADAVEPVHIPPRAREARLPLANWHRVQAVLGFLAWYSRQVAEPEDMERGTKHD